MRHLLAEAVRIQFRPGESEAFLGALAAAPLSPRVVAFADTVYALPALAAACRRTGARPSDPAVTEALDAAYYLCAARRVGLQLSMEQVGAALASGAVPFLVLKGGALEVLAPNAPAVRVTADLDVLVPRGKMIRAEALLQAAGFRPGYEGHAEEFHRHSHHAVPYLSGSGLGVVEIHERLEPRGAICRLPVEPIWERSLVVRRAGREWRVPSLTDLALHTCVHYGLIHPYNTALRRLWDLGVLSHLDTFGDPSVAAASIDWAEVERLARQYGSRKVVRQARVELEWLLEGGVEPDWSLSEAPYSGRAAFRLQQAATDTLWGRARGAWHFLFPGPHETAPVRGDRSHAAYLMGRFAKAVPRAR